jgi:hypothetical protein
MKRHKTLLIYLVLPVLIIGQNELLFSQSADNNSVINKEYNMSSLDWNLKPVAL